MKISLNLAVFLLICSLVNASYAQDRQGSGGGGGWPLILNRNRADYLFKSLFQSLQANWQTCVHFQATDPVDLFDAYTQLTAMVNEANESDWIPSRSCDTCSSKKNRKIACFFKKDKGFKNTLQDLEQVLGNKKYLIKDSTKTASISGQEYIDFFNRNNQE